jgi:hypothetical protein
MAANSSLKFRYGSRSDNYSIISRQKLCLWLLKSAAHSGVGYAIAALKKGSADVRLFMISGGTLTMDAVHLLRRFPNVRNSSTKMLQLSYIGRSMPEGNEYVARKNLSKHKSIVSSVHNTDPAILSYAYNYASKFAARKLDGVETEVIPVSPSSTFTSSRKQGGAREELRIRCQAYLEREGFDVWSLPVPNDFVPTHDVMEMRRSMAASTLMNSTAKCTTGVKPSKVIAIRERGWKRRVITSPSLEAVVSSTALNKTLLGALKKEERCKRFLTGDRNGAISGAINGAPLSHVCISTDLSNASDLLPLDLVSAVVEGLIKGWKNLPSHWADALRSLTGVQELHYPDGDIIYSTRGILMGLGPTWPILSLIHLIWVDYAARLSGNNPSRSCARRNTAIGGDDLVGMWTKELIHNYQHVVKTCGGAFSEGKVYYSKTGGNFTEISFRIVPRVIEVGQSPVCEVKWYSGIPIKGFVGLSTHLAGAAFEAVYNSNLDPAMFERARKIVKVLYPHAWSFFRRLGITPTLPRTLGGAGLPPQRGSINKINAPFKMRLALGKYLYGTFADYVMAGSPPSWQESTDRAIMYCRKSAELTLQNAVTLGEFNVIDSFEQGTFGELSINQWIKKDTALQSQSLIFTSDPILNCLSGIPDPYRFQRLLNDWIRKVLAGGLPDALAISNGVNTRRKLLAKVKSIKNRWIVMDSYCLWAPMGPSGGPGPDLPPNFDIASDVTNTHPPTSYDVNRM